jgi:hypothetical protein
MDVTLLIALGGFITGLLGAVSTLLKVFSDRRTGINNVEIEKTKAMTSEVSVILSAYSKLVEDLNTQLDTSQRASQRETKE